MADMEQADGCPGKYTVGLGQEAMAFTSDREDAVSMALTVAHSLMEKYGVRPDEIGHVQVATESGVDRSKSVMSHLMALFQPPQPTHQPPAPSAAAAAHPGLAPTGTASGVGAGAVPHARSTSGAGAGSAAGVGLPARPPWSPPEGADCVHACYGGTSALLAAAAWVESRRWDGRLALVVASDVALYPPGSAARPTGGCGAAALLVGPHAPLVLDPLWYGNHAEHSWDFYKPLGRLPYPEVDGPSTLEQYLGAAGRCALRLAERLTAAAELAPGEALLPRVHHFVAHSPFARLARKGLARLELMDRLRAAAAETLRSGAHAAGEAAAAPAGGQAEAARAVTALAAAPPGAATAEAATPRVSAIADSAAGGHSKSPHEGKAVVVHAVTVAAPPDGPKHQLAGPGRGAGCGQAGDGASAEPQVGGGRADGAGVGRTSGGGPVGGDEAAGAAQGPVWAAEWVMLQEQQAGAGTREALPAPGAGGAAAAGGTESAAAVTPDGNGAGVAAGAPTPCPATSAPASEPTGSDGVTTASASPPHPAAPPAATGGCRGAGMGDVGLGPGVRPPPEYESYAKWRLDDKALEAALLRETEAAYRDKAGDAAWLPKQLGNSYTACIFQGLASLVWRQGPRLHGRRLLLFSFGSGTVAKMYSLVVPPTTADRGGPRPVGDPYAGRFSLEVMQRALDLDRRLSARVGRVVSHFNAVAAVAAAAYSCPVPYEPLGDLADVATGSYYLVRVDEHSRRWYARKA